MNSNNMEIERKFLIKYPSCEYLASNGSYTDITQIYLNSDIKGMSERVRKRGRDGAYIYTHTSKAHLSDMRRIEIENEIDEAEYNELLKRADTKRRVIVKTRWCINYHDQIVEIDVYPFWSDRAILEIEMADEKQEIFIPPEIEVICEVTEDKRYTNASLAKEIPCDDIG